MKTMTNCSSVLYSVGMSTQLCRVESFRAPAGSRISGCLVFADSTSCGSLRCWASVPPFLVFVPVPVTAFALALSPLIFGFMCFLLLFVRQVIHSALRDYRISFTNQDHVLKLIIQHYRLFRGNLAHFESLCFFGFVIISVSESVAVWPEVEQVHTRPRYLFTSRRPILREFYILTWVLWSQ